MGDVLIFFDFVSLYQIPRTLQQNDSFQQALGIINFLYFSFDVLVITEIPLSVKHHGHYLDYMAKGWCWAEASIANIGGSLMKLSQSVQEVLAKEQATRLRYFSSLSEALHGYPRYPEDLLP